MGVIIPFDGAHASIPSGWTRNTTLDDKFPKSADAIENVGDTGGNATHTHTSSSHSSHGWTGHGHSITTGAFDGTQEAGTTDQSSGSGNHTHSGTISTLAGESIDAVAVTYAAFSNEPPFLRSYFYRKKRPDYNSR